jgi:hypothetical protein
LPSCNEQANQNSSYFLRLSPNKQNALTAAAALPCIFFQEVPREQQLIFHHPKHSEQSGHSEFFHLVSDSLDVPSNAQRFYPNHESEVYIFAHQKSIHFSS